MNWPTRLFSARTSTALLLTSALFSFGSCEDPNEVGLDVPGTTPVNVNYQDFAVNPSTEAFTVLQDSLATTQKDHFIVGRLQDSNTGALLEAKAYLEIRPSNDTIPAYFNVPSQAIDSVVMFAGFDQVYGSATAPVRLSLYNLRQPLDDFTPYNSTSTILADQAVKTDIPVSLNRVIRNSKNTADSVQLPLRLPLLKTGETPTQPVQALLNLLRTTSGVRLTQAQLRTVWPGLELRPASLGTAIGFNRSTQSEVVVYYRVPTAPVARQKKAFRIFFGDSSPTGSLSEPRYFTNINYDLSAAGTPFGVLQGNAAAQVPAASANGITYAQAGTGLATKIVIPGLEELRTRQQAGELFINRAELIVPLQPYSTGQFGIPPQLFLYEVGANNQVLRFRNGAETVERIVQRDGANVTTTNQEAALVYNRVSATNQYYTALITSYVQAYTRDQLAGPRPAALMLSPSLRRLGSLSLDRAAIDAGKIRLRVYYSEAKP